MKLNDFLKYERKKQKLTLIQLSKRASISYGMLYRLEEGAIKQPKPNLLKQVADALSINYETLLLKYGYITPTQDSQQEIIKKEKEVIALSDFINNSNKRIGIIEYMNQKEVGYMVQCDSNQLLPFSKKGDVLGLNKVKHMSEHELYLRKEDDTHVGIYTPKKRGPELILVKYDRPFIEIKHTTNELYKIVFRHSDKTISRKK